MEMNEQEKIINKLEECLCASCRGFKPGIYCPWPDEVWDNIKSAIDLLKAQKPITGKTSDGYHTFNELYHHRAVLFSVIVANYPDRAWKSKKHHDGTMYDGMFIVGIETPDGQATYHYDIEPYWDMFKCRELESAPEWDRHTPAQAIERIGRLALLKEPVPRVMTLEVVQGLHISDIVWLEEKENHVVIPVLVRNRQVWPHTSSMMTNFTRTDRCTITVADDDYMIHWRCWTSRPTDEQRKAVKWSERE